LKPCQGCGIAEKIMFFKKLNWYNMTKSPKGWYDYSQRITTNNNPKGVK
jgi:hypothetical protein